MFRTQDAHLVVGHPDEVRTRLGLARSPEVLKLSALRALDHGSTATVEEYVMRAAELCAGEADRLPIVLLEPKGSAAASVGETIAQISKLATRVGVRHFIALWLEQDLLAAEAVEAAAATPVGGQIATLYPIKSRHVEPDGRPLTRHDVRTHRAWNGAGPFWKMLTAGFAQEVHGRGQWLYTWVINDDAALSAALVAGADAIVSDSAVRMREHLLGFA
jgi:glycerophosphoryl diester phosphodiesterase